MMPFPIDRHVNRINALVQCWNLIEIDAPQRSRSAAVLETVDGARAIVIRLAPGEALGETELVPASANEATEGDQTDQPYDHSKPQAPDDRDHDPGDYEQSACTNAEAMMPGHSVRPSSLLEYQAQRVSGGGSEPAVSPSSPTWRSPSCFVPSSSGRQDLTPGAVRRQGSGAPPARRLAPAVGRGVRRAAAFVLALWRTRASLLWSRFGYPRCDPCGESVNLVGVLAGRGGGGAAGMVRRLPQRRGGWCSRTRLVLRLPPVPVCVGLRRRLVFGR
jgi:hypothetical protein